MQHYAVVAFDILVRLSGQHCSAHLSHNLAIDAVPTPVIVFIACGWPLLPL